MALVTRALNNTGAPLSVPGGSVVPTGTQISFTLIHPPGKKTVGDAWDATTMERVGGTVLAYTDASGLFSTTLWPNDRGNVVTQYLCKVGAPGFPDFIGVMPSGSGAYSWVNFYLSGAPLTPAQLSLLAEHIADFTVHLTPAQNTFMDGLNLPTLTAAEVNYVAGVTSSVQAQLNNRQPLDAELTALAGAGSAANTVSYWTGVGSAARTALTAFGRTVLGYADAAAMLVGLGATPSTRTISTVSPLTGGGPLTSDLSISTLMNNGSVLGRNTADAPGVAAQMSVQAPMVLKSNQFRIEINTARLAGRTTVGVGSYEEISVGDGLVLAAGVLSATPLSIAEKLTTADVFADFVVSGMELSFANSPDITIQAGVAYVNGFRTETEFFEDIRALGDRDVYVDLTADGEFTFEDVPNGNPEPALTPDSLRIGKYITTTGGAIVSVQNWKRDALPVGVGSLPDLTVGVGNVALGAGAGAGIVDGGGNTILGAGVGTANPSMTNTLLAGAGGVPYLSANGVTFDALLPLVVPSVAEADIYTTYPPATKPYQIVGLSDVPGLAYSYGLDWRRASDNTVI